MPTNGLMEKKKKVKYMGDRILFSLFKKEGNGDERNGELMVNGDRQSFSLGRWQNSGWWGWFCNNMNVLSATELYM